FFTPNSSAADDFHYLTVLSRLQAPWTTNVLAKVPRTIVSLDRKTGGQDQRNKQNWTPRLTEVVQRLILRNRTLPRLLMSEPDFVRPAHVALVPLFEPEQYLASARMFLQAVQRDARFPWSVQLVDLLSSLPPADIFPVLRRQWQNVAIRDEIILKLAQTPEPIDRPKFVAG